MWETSIKKPTPTLPPKKNPLKTTKSYSVLEKICSCKFCFLNEMFKQAPMTFGKMYNQLF